MKKQLLFAHIFTLLFGGIIYIIFRKDTLLMFNWFDSLSIQPLIEYIRSIQLIQNIKLPSWFIFSLPGGLWIFSYITIMLFIWKNKVTQENLFWFLIIPIIALFSEIGQLLQVLPGTFDFIDLVFYLFGFIIPFKFSNILLIPKTN